MAHASTIPRGGGGGPCAILLPWSPARTFGSRQEEAQRLGRILRPKADGGQARFYALVTRETKDQEFAMHRQLFLAEQGYRYEILDERDILDTAPSPGSPSPQ